MGVNSAPGEFDVLLMMGERVDHAEFYPFDQGLIANAAPQEVHSSQSRTAILIRVTKDSIADAGPGADPRPDQGERYDGV